MGCEKCGLESFRIKEGSRVRRFSFNGKVFVYSISISKKGPSDYEIVDSNGDGKFDTKLKPLSNPERQNGC